MTRRSLREFLYSAASIGSGSSSVRTLSPSPSLNSMDQSLFEAQDMIMKWDANSSAYAKITSLFHSNRKEGKEYLRRVGELRKVMNAIVAADASSPKLVHAQKLMETAMKRLEKEFYQILASNRDHLDPESVSGRSSARASTSDSEPNDSEDDEIQRADESIAEVERVSSLAMSDLQSIAECMISSGYGKECVKIYTLVRRSIVDEGLYKLGVERSISAHKVDWVVLEMKIKVWLHAARVALKTLFAGERILCDHVFASSDSIRQSCYSEIAAEAALSLFSFPESIAKGKRAPERMFRMLDMYDAISDLWPEIDAVFSDEVMASVRSKALSALVKLGETIRLLLSDFESAIQKDTSKTPVPGAGIHPLTRYTMNYLGFLADYQDALGEICADWPLNVPESLPEGLLEYSADSLNSPTSAAAARLSWLVLVLLCKLDGKAQHYKDVAQSYLFLINNLNYVVAKVQGSELGFLLGEEWIAKHAAKVKQYAPKFERVAWGKVIMTLQPGEASSLESINDSEARVRLARFNFAFEEAIRMQSGWSIPDSKLREELKATIAQRVVPAYRSFYVRLRSSAPQVEMVPGSGVKYAPEDLVNHISHLFSGSSVSSGHSSSHSS
ncbi:hypothetical protein AMTRI_Chr08g164070 [Amborella trichopoda]